jgi:hypothetical protein
MDRADGRLGKSLKVLEITLWRKAGKVRGEADGKQAAEAEAKLRKLASFGCEISVFFSWALTLLYPPTYSRRYRMTTASCGDL